VFVLRYDYAESPRAVGIADDPRLLSARVDAISFVPK
jgi:hypothetical protein